MVVESHFKTREIALVAYLETQGIKPDEYEVTLKGNKKVATFNFNKNEKFMELKNKYFEGNTSVEPMSFMDSIRRIKTKINNTD